MTGRIVLGSVMASFSLLAFAAAASAAIPFCPAGSGAGQCNSPQGVATDEETGRVYVADQGNHRINVFEPDGDFIRAFGWGVLNGESKFQVCIVSCQSGLPGTNLGQFSSPSRIAVDNIAGSATRHDIYVMDAARRLQRFTSEPPTPVLSFPVAPGSGECQFGRGGNPIAVGPGGVVYVADTAEKEGETVVNRIERFAPTTGACIDEVVLVEGGNFTLRALAVDGTENTYVALEGAADNALRKYSPSGAFLQQLDHVNPGKIETNALSIDAAGHLFAAQRDANAPQGFQGVITEYDGSGTHLKRFGYGTLPENVPGIGIFHSPGGDVFASTDIAGIKYLAIPADSRPIVVPEPCKVKAGTLGNTRATLQARVNPESLATTIHFEYVNQAHFEAEGFANAEESPESGLGADFHTQEAAVKVEGLAPETVYHCRVLAENIDGEATGAEGTFETREPLECGPAFATNVEKDSAIVTAELNPLGIATEGQFEYVTDAEFQLNEFDSPQKAPAEIDYGEGETTVPGGTELTGLVPDTLYHFRLRATNAFFPLPGGIVCPEDEEGDPSFASFKTFPAPGAGLPDARRYELVSPAEKNSAEVAVPGVGGGLFLDSYVRIQAAAGSGEAITYTSWTSFADPQAAPGTSQYISRRNANGWGTENISPSHFQGEPLGQFNPLLPVYRGFTHDLRLGGVVLTQAMTSGERINNVYLRDNGAGTLQRATPEEPIVEAPELCHDYAGSSADGHRVFFAANASYAGAPLGSGFNLYEWSATEGMRLVSVLPTGNPATPNADSAFGTRGGHCSSGETKVRHVVSADGSRVFWTYVPNTGATQLLARIDGAETVQLDKKVSGTGSSGGGVFETATADGSQVFFTAVNKLKTGASVGDLYLYELSTRELKDLTAGPEAANVKGVVGISEDGSYVYFVAGGVLSGEEENSAGEKAQAGESNLYLYHEGEITYIATLSSVDGDAAWSSAPKNKSAQVSPDGRHLAFLSTESKALAGFDNAIAGGEHCQLPTIEGSPLIGSPLCPQAFLYNAETEELSCASCNPSGSRPLGPTELPGWSNPFEGRRFLSVNGTRLFFESFDTLLPADDNDKRDVYEFELPGEGSCTGASPSFDPASGGCHFLVSSGRSEDESFLIDASTNGRDVFFSTRQPLVGWDHNDNYDVYDFRAGGGFPEPQEVPVCVGEGCKEPPKPPPLPATPATPGFVGQGNVKPKKQKQKKASKKHKKKSKKSKKQRKHKARR